MMKQPLPSVLAGLRGVALGYDGGDFLFLGEFRDGRFVANVQAG
jgi:hypothetical protein